MYELNFLRTSSSRVLSLTTQLWRVHEPYKNKGCDILGLVWFPWARARWWTYHAVRETRPVQRPVTFPSAEHYHRYSIHGPLGVGGWVGLSVWLHTETVYHRTVTNLRTNLTERRITSAVSSSISNMTSLSFFILSLSYLVLSYHYYRLRCYINILLTCSYCAFLFA